MSTLGNNLKGVSSRLLRKERPAGGILGIHAAEDVNAPTVEGIVTIFISSSDDADLMEEITCG